MLRDISNVIKSRWYGLAVVTAASTNGFLWFILPNPVWWFSIFTAVLLLPLVFQRGQKQIPVMIHGAVVLFLISAAIGVWSAYLPAAAVDKFGMILAAVLLFYAVACQQRINTWTILAGVGLFGSLFAIYFSLSYDWRLQAVDTALVNRVGVIWMGYRPTIHLPGVDDDIAGGIFAVLLPVVIPSVLYSLKSRRLFLFLYSSATSLLILAGLFLTGLRAAWVGIIVGTVLAFFILVLQNLMLRISARAFQVISVVLIVMMIAGGVGLLGVLSGELFPGIESSALYWAVRSRFHLFRNAWDLASDLFLLGGGLASFSGHYSRYILSIIPHFMSYSHNMYLDILIEQGIIGLASFLAIVLACAWLLFTTRYNVRKLTYQDFLPIGVMVGLLTMLVQGMFENSLYGMRGTPLLFLLPALVMLTLDREKRVNLQEVFPVLGNRRRMKYVISTVLILSIGVTLVFHRTIIAQWHANLGMIEMAKVELADWPHQLAGTHLYLDGTIEGAEHRLRTALTYDSGNRTANYLLGRIAVERREFHTAIEHLEKAYAHDQRYYGIRKNLGYSYVFSGQIEAAHGLLDRISEAKEDMRLYNWWWGLQGRDDLAMFALQYVESNY
jgi:O-antigen ligase